MGRLKSTQTNTTVRTIAMIFLFWFYLCLAVSEAQECRQLKYSQPVQDRALTNHVILKIKTTRQDICNVKCFIEPNCLSYNVGPLDENHQYLCEINDSDEVLHPGDLVRRSGFAYQGTQSPCRNGACVKNSTCQAGYTSKGYRCICPTGYTGLSCSQDIDECDVDGGHDCHVNADCVNTEGSFNCTCSLGYIGDGRDCIECGAVGVEDRNKIPDARMTASTYFGSNFYPYFGRLNENRGDGAWCAKTSTDNADYLQVDMGAVKSVCAVATQGEKVGSYWTTSYKVRLSTDAVTWKRYRENNVQKVFAGNTDQNSIVKHSVSPNVNYQARFVRFYPVSHHGHPCLRVEIFALK